MTSLPTPPSSEARNLLSLYITWRKSTLKYVQFIKQGKRFRNPSFNEANIKAMQDMVTFCRFHNISPVGWLNYLFEYRKWLNPPRLAEEDLMSDKALKSYLENKNRVVGTTLGYYGYKEALNPSVKVASSVDPNKDIIHVVEALKDKLVSLGKEETCMNNTFAISFPTNGFHPKSEVCQRCKLRDTCRTQLVTNVDFDIIGLRLGRITPEEAKREAYVRRNK